ncbi:NAD(P)-dependent alcohol dehydrogenase [Chloroflexota bacterium]
MKAIVYEEYGPPDVFQLKDVEKPAPDRDEVLIRVHATTVTTGDVNAREFLFVPPGLGPLARLMFGFSKPKLTILGTEFAGVIEGIGQDVKLFKEGDQVFGIDGEGLGAYAEYKCMSEGEAIAEKPTNLTFAEAASIPNGFGTSYYFLKEKGNIQSGQKVLINGASGSVGTAGVQLAKHYGAEVTGVCSTRNIEFVKSLGADKVIDYTKEDFTKNGGSYDLILDTVHGETSFSRCKDSLSENGYYLAVAGGVNEMILSGWTSVFGSKKVIFGGGMAVEKKDYLLLFKELIEAGEIKPVIDKSYPLGETAEAHRYTDTGRKRGNVVITVEHNDE